MRLIDADELEKILTDAIMIQEGMAVALGIEKDEGVQMELKAYRDILNGVKEQPTIGNDPMADKDILISDLNDISEILNNNGYGGWCSTIRKAAALLKEQEAKQYNNHEVACIIADLFGDPCACNFNNIDEWLPYKCDFRETCCPNPVGVACWEQYLKHKEGR